MSDDLGDFSPIEMNAANSIIKYVLGYNLKHTPKINPPTRYATKSVMEIDHLTRKSLELVKNLNKGTRANTLLASIDHTKTGPGARLLLSRLRMLPPPSPL